MDLQRRLLRAMLWMLGLAAGAGVLTIFASARVMGRVAGTALIAAIAVGMAMPVSRMLDDEKKRTGGTVGLGTIVVSFILALGAIWVDLVGRPMSNIEWRLAATSVLVCIGGLIACNLLVPRAAGWGRAARPAALCTVVLGTLFLGLELWLDSTGGDKFLETGFLVLGSGLLGAMALVGLGVEPRPWRWAGVLTSAGGLVLGLLGVWVVPSDNPSIFITTMCAATVVGYANVVLSVPLGDSRTWACLVSIGSIAATGACVSVLSFITGGFDQRGPDILTRLTGALGIVSACSTLGIVVLYRLNRRPPGTSASVSGIDAVRLACPHCGHRLTAPIGESACEGCGLLISVKVREPRCTQCDYPLLGLKGGRCPECGTERAGLLESRHTEGG